VSTGLCSAARQPRGCLLTQNQAPGPVLYCGRSTCRHGHSLRTIRCSRTLCWGLGTLHLPRRWCRPRRAGPRWLRRPHSHSWRRPQSSGWPRSARSGSCGAPRPTGQDAMCTHCIGPLHEQRRMLPMSCPQPGLQGAHLAMAASCCCWCWLDAAAAAADSDCSCCQYVSAQCLGKQTTRFELQEVGLHCFSTVVPCQAACSTSIRGNLCAVVCSNICWRNTPVPCSLTARWASTNGQHRSHAIRGLQGRPHCHDSAHLYQAISQVRASMRAPRRATSCSASSSSAAVAATASSSAGATAQLSLKHCWARRLAHR
jgi:hypothetical protein